MQMAQKRHEKQTVLIQRTSLKLNAAVQIQERLPIRFPSEWIKIKFTIGKAPPQNSIFAAKPYEPFPFFYGLKNLLLSKPALFS